jgi:HAD superfamily hydrolase (TIGR01509 family)
VKNKKRTIIFDMDGVLLDTSDNTHAFREVLLTYGIHLDRIYDPHQQQWRGGSLQAMVTAIKTQFDVHIDIDELARRVDAAHFERMARQNTTAHPELHALLTDLQSRKVRIGLGSASRTGRIYKILDQLEIQHFFDIIVGAEAVAEHKPHPGVYLHTASALGVHTDDCIVVEDTAAGVEAAKRAGMTVVGFYKFQENEGALKDADHVAHDYSELRRTLIENVHGT